MQPTLRLAWEASHLDWPLIIDVSGFDESSLATSSVLEKAMMEQNGAPPFDRLKRVNRGWWFSKMLLPRYVQKQRTTFQRGKRKKAQSDI